MFEEWLLHSLGMLLVGGVAIHAALMHWKTHRAIAQRVIAGAVLCVLAITGDNFLSWWFYPMNHEAIDSSRPGTSSPSRMCWQAVSLPSASGSSSRLYSSVAARK